MFPRGYRRVAIVAFFVGLGLFLAGVTMTVMTAMFPPSSGLGGRLDWLGALLFGFAVYGFGGFLASWALMGGRHAPG